jgi:hypothetical protein
MFARLKVLQNVFAILLNTVQCQEVHAIREIQ